MTDPSDFKPSLHFKGTFCHIFVSHLNILTCMCSHIGHKKLNHCYVRFLTQAVPEWFTDTFNCSKNTADWSRVIILYTLHYRVYEQSVVIIWGLFQHLQFMKRKTKGKVKHVMDNILVVIMKRWWGHWVLPAQHRFVCSWWTSKCNIQAQESEENKTELMSGWRLDLPIHLMATDTILNEWYCCS